MRIYRSGGNRKESNTMKNNAKPNPNAAPRSQQLTKTLKSCPDEPLRHQTVVPYAADLSVGCLVAYWASGRKGCQLKASQVPFNSRKRHGFISAGSLKTLGARNHGPKYHSKLRNKVSMKKMQKNNLNIKGALRH